MPVSRGGGERVVPRRPRFADQEVVSSRHVDCGLVFGSDSETESTVTSSSSSSSSSSWTDDSWSEPSVATTSQCTFRPRITKTAQNLEGRNTTKWETRMYYDAMCTKAERKRENHLLRRLEAMKSEEDIQECTFKPKILKGDGYHRMRDPQHVYSTLYDDAMQREELRKYAAEKKKRQDELADRVACLREKNKGRRRRRDKPENTSVEAGSRLHRKAAENAEKLADQQQKAEQKLLSQQLGRGRRVVKKSGDKLPWERWYEEGLARQQKRNTALVSAGGGWREGHVKQDTGEDVFHRLYVVKERGEGGKEVGEEECTFKPQTRELPQATKDAAYAYKIRKQAQKKLFRKKKRHPSVTPPHPFHHLASIVFTSEPPTYRSTPEDRPPIHPKHPTTAGSYSSEETHPDNVTDEDLSE